MSYILEALRKAERERSIGQVPTLDTHGESEGPGRSRGWLWIVAAALLVNAAVLAAWLLTRAPETAEVVTALPAESPPEATFEPAIPPPAIADYLPPPTTVIETPVGESTVISAAPAETAPRAEPKPAPFPEVQEVEEPAAETSIAETPAIEDKTAVGEVTPLREMPADFRRSLPPMKMDAHFHTDVPGRSFVMINLRKYKPGERTAEGPQVVDIVAEGVVLSYQGQQFLLPP